jgi:hypothetical protein
LFHRWAFQRNLLSLCHWWWIELNANQTLS